MNLQLKTVFGDLIFKGDFTSIADLVSAALANKLSLRYADLTDADLTRADLYPIKYDLWAVLTTRDE